LAALRERAVVRVTMAVGALAKCDAGISRLIVRAGRMALLAPDLNVQASEREPGLRVIELLGADHLPVGCVVALHAVGPQASLVSVLMATDAAWGEPEEGAIQVFHLDRGALRRRNLFCRVALLAGEGCVFPVESKSSLCVIKILCVPLHQRKVFAIVVRVTTGAALARSRRNIERGMQTLMSCNPGSNLGVAFKAFEGALASEAVASGAVARSVQRLMGAGERSWRNLRVRRTVQTHRCDDRQQQGKKWMLRSHVTHESTRDQISFLSKIPKHD
jgi:hypothetical protein